jgi:hypothetical protein
MSWLKRQQYAFTTTTPRTHAIVRARNRAASSVTLRDAFGWSRPFESALLPPPLFDRLRAEGLIVAAVEGWRAMFRVSTLGDRFYLHSPFPTEDADAVFFGPDTYRFLRFIEAHLPNDEGVNEICDLGTGAGVAAIELAGRFPEARVIGIDSNPKALDFAAVNADFNGARVEWRRAESIAQIERRFDLIVMNPPFIADEGKRVYRDGGDLLGAGSTVQWVHQSIGKLRPSGRLLVYSGSPIVEGTDELHRRLAQDFDSLLHYEELDPDIFGEELERPVYASVERIALIGAVLTSAA